MNETNFFKGFTFNIFKFSRYHFTDNSKTPIPCHYFACLKKGTAKIKTKTEEILLTPGEILYFPKGLRYQSQWFADQSGRVEFYSFGFEISPINESFILQKIDCSKKAKEVFKELCEEVPITQKGIGKLYYFFGEVASNMIKDKSQYKNFIVQKAMEIITENPYIKISELAKLCNVSESGLYPVFKKHAGKTPNEMRLEILCEKAVLLLTTTNKTVQEISDTLGVSSTSYFRKILKKYTNKTPLEIRKDAIF